MIKESFGIIVLDLNELNERCYFEKANIFHLKTYYSKRMDLEMYSVLNFSAGTPILKTNDPVLEDTFTDNSQQSNEEDNGENPVREDKDASFLSNFSSNKSQDKENPDNFNRFVNDLLERKNEKKTNSVIKLPKKRQRGFFIEEEPKLLGKRPRNLEFVYENDELMAKPGSQPGCETLSNRPSEINKLTLDFSLHKQKEEKKYEELKAEYDEKLKKVRKNCIFF
jgi:hypothetical protein